MEILDVSGDIGLRVTSATMEELFVKAACALFSLITDFEKISALESREIALAADSLDDLIVAWFNELIYNFDAFGFLCKDVSINELSQRHIKAAVKGEIFDGTRHNSGFMIKAATYHNLKLVCEPSFSSLEIILDI
ncbi:archease [Candidatus Magnetomonas plexicatena]|uniref:archease n=1 Tax=Candidatus Magnetomonas plexicatena TaxID=2552947 RepID=UPI001C74278B|nr:archease [Nitrospirales bacterium LBB_01]